MFEIKNKISANRTRFFHEIGLIIKLLIYYLKTGNASHPVTKLHDCLRHCKKKGTVKKGTVH